MHFVLVLRCFLHSKLHLCVFWWPCVGCAALPKQLYTLCCTCAAVLRTVLVVCCCAAHCAGCVLLRGMSATVGGGLRVFSPGHVADCPAAQRHSSEGTTGGIHWVLSSLMHQHITTKNTHRLLGDINQYTQMTNLTFGHTSLHPAHKMVTQPWDPQQVYKEACWTLAQPVPVSTSNC